MISFRYLKLTCVISMAFIRKTVAYEFVHAHVSTMLFSVDVLITQYL